ncbi:MAG TPA: hypothetical protein VK815_12395 [Candidatus Acidoferrales bacterium]|jgi:uncharacterized repeat protein (TIGR01451 family)|nr:hypothetical protein [Candidatus Acidoferrales bacterium]
MNLSRTLRYSIIKIIRFWKRLIEKPKAELSFILAPLWAEKNHPANNRRDVAKNKQKPSKAQSLVFPSAPNEKPSEGHDNHVPKKPYAFRENVKYLLEVMGVLGGMVGVIILICQLSIMNSQTTSMQNQLLAMHEATDLEERAWIYVSGISYHPDTKTFEITLKNAGKTPALNVQSISRFATGKNLIPESDPFPNVTTNGLTITPEIPCWVKSPIIPDAVIEASKHGQGFYVFGTVWYDDVFRKLHWIQFCYEINGDNSGQFPTSMTQAIFHDACDDEKH